MFFFKKKRNANSLNLSMKITKNVHYQNFFFLQAPKKSMSCHFIFLLKQQYTWYLLYMHIYIYMYRKNNYTPSIILIPSD